MQSPVDDYIYNLSIAQQDIAVKVRQMIVTLVPGIQEKLSFKIPFYHYHGMFCYINAIPNGIDVGFCRGKDFASEFEHLETKGRAIVATIRLYSVKDIQQKGLREIIVVAALWNEEAKKKKLPMVKKAAKKQKQ
jgi:hypothetical protein